MEQTVNNLKSALIGETTASAKYAAFSEKAKQEGYTKIAIMFEAISRSEAVHANNHKRVLEHLIKEKVQVQPETYEVKSTSENLQNAINGESYEVDTMYPDFIEISTQEGVQRATGTFSDAFETEKKHKLLFENALSELNNNKEQALSSKYFVCPSCGFTYNEFDVKDECEVCGVKKEKFIVFQI